MKKSFLLYQLFACACFSLNLFAGLSCLNHDLRVNLEKRGSDLDLRIESENGKPLLPSIDRRIRTIEVGPMPCAQTHGNATVCFTDVCRYEKFYDANGVELTDIEHSGDVLFTATPEKSLGDDGYTDQLKVHFEINDWYFIRKHAVDMAFEIYPGKYCN